MKPPTLDLKETEPCGEETWGPGLGTSGSTDVPTPQTAVYVLSTTAAREPVGAQVSWGPRGWKLPLEITARPATAARLAQPRSQHVIKEVGFQLGHRRALGKPSSPETLVLEAADDVSQPPCQAPSVFLPDTC